MIIGTHQLKGKVEQLQEPFCIMEQERFDDGDDDNDENFRDDNDDEKKTESTEQQDKSVSEYTKSTSSKTSYNIVGIIRQKFLFNQYPKTIMR